MHWFALAISVVVLGISAVMSAAETAVLMLTQGRVHRLVESERPGAAALEHLSDLRHRLRSASALVAGVAFGSAGVAGFLIGAQTRFSYLLGSLLSLAAVLFVHALGQALPRTLAVTNPERVGLETAPFVWSLVRSLYPVTKSLGAPWKWAVSLSGVERPYSPWAVIAEWRATEPDAESERETSEEALLEAVSDFAEKVAREVMVPRTDVKALPDTATPQEAIRLIVKSGFSRVPVFHDTIDDVRGVVYAKDLLGAIGSGKQVPDILSVAREAYFVPETKSLEELLIEMRERTHIAIVADEYGGTAGIVTLEDLLEEIVGEISDEYDREEPLVVDLGEGRFRLDARLPVDDLNEVFGTDIETDADSVGGLFTELAGRIPELGEDLEVERLRLTVVDLQGTRIRQLVAEPAAPATEGETDA